MVGKAFDPITNCPPGDDTMNQDYAVCYKLSKNYCICQNLS